MVIIVGLGNIGSRYSDTYHNVGFNVVDKLAKKLGVVFSKEKYKAMIGEGMYNGQKILLAKPTTFMNNSGEAVSLLKQKNKEARIIVVVDDIDLPVGKIRYRESGSAGTHNGLRSITSFIGQDFERVRVGIGRDESKDLADFVLSKIEDKDKFEKIYDQAVDMILEKIG